MNVNYLQFDCVEVTNVAPVSYFIPGYPSLGVNKRVPRWDGQSYKDEEQ